MRTPWSRTIICVLFTSLAACGDEAGDALPRVVQQPQSVSITECEGARFDVQVSSDGPVSYQWFSDGVAIPGATGTTYEVPRAGVRSSGKRFSVQIGSQGGTVMSQDAVLTVAAADGPVLLASGFAWDLTTDGSEVFWTAGRAVAAVDVDCERTYRILYEGSYAENTDAITISGERVFWTDSYGGRINAVTKDGLRVDRVAEQLGTWLWGITVSNDEIFWINVKYGIQMAPLAGSTITTLVPGLINSDGLTVDDQSVYWYVLNGGDSPVMQVSRGGGEPRVLVSGLEYPSGIVTDGAFVYVADTQGSQTDTPVGRLLRVSRDGGEPTFLATEAVAVNRLALDGAFIYWTSGNVSQPGSGSVSRIALDGSGTRTVLAQGLTGASKIAVDDRYVYWTDHDGIKRVRKQ